MALEAKNSLAFREVCLGSLSCMKQCEWGNFWEMKGSRKRVRISMQNDTSIFPSKMHTRVAPLLLIPAQTWTLMACFGLGFSFGGWPCLRKDMPSVTLQLNWSCYHSKSHHQMFHCLLCMPAQRLSILTCSVSSISWQYREPWYVHPSSLRHRFIVAKLMWTPIGIVGAVAGWLLSHHHIAFLLQATWCTVGVSLVRLPDPGFSH